ncbi:hypothetical protein D3C84_1054760 [compost metagenome]
MSISIETKPNAQTPPGMLRQMVPVDTFSIGAVVDVPPDLSVAFILSLENQFGIRI